MIPPPARYIGPLALLIASINGRLAIALSRLITNSFGVNIAGTVSVPLGTKNPLFA